MNFAFDFKTRQQLGYRLVDRVNDYFSSLRDRSVQPPVDMWAIAKSDLGTMPESGEDALKVLDEVCSDLIDNGFHVPSANYLGLVNPTPTYLAVLADALVSALNPQLASVVRSRRASEIEAQTIHWIGERVGWKTSFGGTFTSGGNEANLSAIALALTWRFPTWSEEGLAEIGARPVLYASSEAHHSLDKSAGLLGLGRKALRRIPVDSRCQLDLVALEDQIAEDQSRNHVPFCVVGTLGTTSSGAIDDLMALSAICRRHQLWFHVDAAYGGAVIFSNRHRALASGIELSDSVTLDPHKWLAMPFAAGLHLTSHRELLRPTFEVRTPYMPKTEASSELVDNFKVSAQWSRRMNSLKLWLTLRVHGRQAYEDLIDRHLSLANEFADWLRDSELFELAAPQVLPIINLRVKLPGSSGEQIRMANEAIVREVTRDGKQWISTTFVNGQSVIRTMVISYLTERRHLEELLAAMTRAANQQKSAYHEMPVNIL